MWHLVSLCRSKTRKVAAGEEDVNKEVTDGTVEFGFYAITVGSGDFPTTPDRVAHSPAVPTATRFSPSSPHQSPARFALLQPPPYQYFTYCKGCDSHFNMGALKLKGLKLNQQEPLLEACPPPGVGGTGQLQ